MPWNLEAQKLVFQMFDEGHPEKAIVPAVRQTSGCDDKTVRRCVAGLSVLRHNGIDEAERFSLLGGTDHYLRELGRAYNAHRERQTAEPELRPYQDAIYESAWLSHIAMVRGAALKAASGLEAVPMPSAASPNIWAETFGKEEPTEPPFAAKIGPYLGYLEDHVADQRFSTGLNEWETERAAYLTACRRLFDKIGRRVEGETGTTVLAPSRFPQEGVLFTFVEHVYHHVTLRAEGGHGREGYFTEVREETSLVPGQGVAYSWWYGGKAFAVHRDRGGLESWRQLSSRLLVDQELGSAAQDLVTAHRKLAEKARPLSETLLREADRGTFDRGGCEACPIPRKPSSQAQTV